MQAAGITVGKIYEDRVTRSNRVLNIRLHLIDKKEHIYAYYSDTQTNAKTNFKNLREEMFRLGYTMTWLGCEQEFTKISNKPCKVSDRENKNVHLKSFNDIKISADEKRKAKQRQYNKTFRAKQKALKAAEAKK